MDFSIDAMINQIAVMALPYILAITVPVIVQAYLADAMGDQTPRMTGRLSIDPLKHADPITSGLFPLLCVLLQSPILFGFAKQLDVNPAAFRPKNGVLYFALAGSLALIVLAILFALTLKILFGSFVTKGWMPEMLVAGVQICCFFSILRLIPIPPGDGAVIVSQFLSRDQAEKYWSIAPYGFIIFIAVIMLLPMVFIYPASILMAAVFTIAGF